MSYLSALILKKFILNRRKYRKNNQILDLSENLDYNRKSRTIKET